MAGKYLYATNFEQKFSNGFTVYQIKLEERATTTQENGFLQLSHNDDFENGEFDNFEENIEVGCTYELLAKPAKRTDSKTEMEQLRLSILPLITAFTTDMDGTSINVQRYYGIDYTVPKAGIPRICYILAENCEDCLQPLSTLIALTGCQKIDTSLFRSFTKQMLLGLTFLHNNRIIHKDIRCDNVLVRQQECPLKKKEYFLKLAHFEKAAFHDLNSKDNKILNIAEGSSRFASTEMQKLASFDWDDSIDVIGTLTDVFSLGCTVLEMYQRSPPNWIYTEKERQKESLFVFAPENKFDDFLANLRGLRNVGANPDISCINEKDALDFVRRCLLPRPERPSSSSLNEMHVFTKEASAKQGSPARYQVSKDEFRLAVIVNGFPQPTDSQYESFAKGVPYGHFTSRRELGMFLANILHESAGLRYRKEISPQPEYGKYYGRGYMQLTWEDNYRKASQALYHDDRLVENPDQVADDEDVAWATACWYWGAVVHSYPGVAEGKFGASIRAINSEEEGMGRNEVKSRARNEYYKRILAVFVPGEAPVESGS
ncbi:uncharacterized protein LOC129597313 isoform X3 [Paramacrobiotus metropolitanus]|uniref:uncharacterized protein LOC129597313 isoform X3 n=1 Tax=Paramacrobiotus metropolitanus TaxID=2943436 RepID=UPI002445D383|nr:uncharacterized protein LOC129597313 isoform X3 [Paramacrobiotus metropolitanus]